MNLKLKCKGRPEFMLKRLVQYFSPNCPERNRITFIVNSQFTVFIKYSLLPIIIIIGEHSEFPDDSGFASEIFKKREVNLESSEC